MEFTLRRAGSRDLPQIHTLLDTIWHNDSGAKAYYLPNTAEYAPGQQHRIVAETASKQCIGFASIIHDDSHPNELYVDVHVHPEWQNLGIGTALYLQLERDLSLFPRLPQQTATYERCTATLQFWERRGFSRAFRTFLPILDVQECSDLMLATMISRVEMNGITLEPVTELLCDATGRNLLATLHWSLYANIHPHHPPSETMYHEREAWFLDGAIIPDAMVVAREGTSYIGVGSLRGDARAGTLDADMTGVVIPAHQLRQQITVALFAKQVQYAKAHGVQSIQAEIDETDSDGMTILNTFPFLMSSPWVHLRKAIDSGVKFAG